MPCCPFEHSLTPCHCVEASQSAWFAAVRQARLLLALILWLLGLASGVMAETVRPAVAVGEQAQVRLFDEDSLDEIEKKYARSGFILTLWSVECPACYKELRLLKEWKQAHPEVGVVFVNVDGVAQALDVREVIEAFKVSAHDNWMFGHTPAAQLRYAIDPQWSGELPRTYLYGPNMQREGVSGVVEEAVLQLWVSMLQANIKQQH